MKKKIKVLFLCHGNICRSTMAESVLTHLVSTRGLSDRFYINSAATSREEIGNGPHYGTVRKLNQVGIPVIPHRAVQMTRQDYLDYDYLIKNFYRIDRTTTINSSELNPSELLAKDLTINRNVDGPVVLIYHTHSQESFVDSDGSDAMSVMGLGDRLGSLLQNVYGIPVLHHLGKYDVDGRDYAYANAEPQITQLLADNPSIQVVIDLHRDGVGEDVRLVTDIDGKPTAKVMFFNGLSRTTATGPIDYLQNPNLQDNLATSLQMQIAAAELYPGFTRPVFLKGYRYNMHLCPRAMLIEVGAQTNTFEEVYNAMDPLANIIAYVLLGGQTGQ